MGNSSSYDRSGSMKLNNQDPIKQKEAQDTLEKSSFFKCLSDLKASFEGDVITPLDDPLYTESRCRPFNLDMCGYPILVVRAKNASDVVKCVNFVRLHGEGVKFCVTCGAHSAKCMLSGSIVLDLQNLNTVEVNHDQLTASVGGGAYLRDMNTALAPYGLGTPIGSYPMVGIGGSTLAGGYGWLSRLHGLSADNLIEAEVVLADGRMVLANDSNDHSDLMKGLRGGGGNFGVVTKFVFKVYNLPPSIFGGMNVFFAPTQASAVECIRNFDRILGKCPSSISASAVLQGGALTIPTYWAYFGDASSPLEVPELQLASHLGGWAAIETSVRPLSYHNELQQLHHISTAGGLSYTGVAQVGNLHEDLPEALLQELIAHTRKALPSCLMKASVCFNSLGGAVVTEGEKELSCINESVRMTRYFVLVECSWRPDSRDVGRIAAKEWAQEALRILRQYKTKRMERAPESISGARHNEAESWVQEATRVANELKTKNMLHAPDALSNEETSATPLVDITLLNLSSIKDKYDPNNLFQQNFNIPSGLNKKKLVVIEGDDKGETEDMSADSSSAV